MCITFYDDLADFCMNSTSCGFRDNAVHNCCLVVSLKICVKCSVLFLLISSLCWTVANTPTLQCSEFIYTITADLKQTTMASLQQQSTGKKRVKITMSKTRQFIHYRNKPKVTILTNITLRVKSYVQLHLAAYTASESIII